MHDLDLSSTADAATSARDGRVSHVAKALIGLVLLAYPVAIYLARDHFTPSQMLAGLLALLGVRSLVAGWILRVHAVRQWVLGAALLLAAVAMALAGNWVRLEWLRFYPVLFDLAVAGMFLGSLFTERSLIERIASLFHREPLSANTIRYARHVTEAWAALMIVIALVATYTAVVSPLATWSLFNGVIVYVVLGAFFAGEYALRRHMKRKWGEA